MALSFASGSLTLSNWGFSAGDVAVLAGAGRKAGTWLVAHLRDRALFDFMKVDVDAVFTRKGLIQTSALHERWDTQIILLKNGRRETFGGGSSTTRRPVVQQMDRFTWLMTLLTAALDVSMQSKDLRETVTLFLLKVFEENESGLEFLRHEVDQHIAGWRSSACVRNIYLRARNIWEGLAITGRHQPGYIPEAELQNVVRFMLWLANGQSTERTFHTASTDIFSLAVVLEELGILINTTENSHELFDESDLVVVWSKEIPYPAAMAQSRQKCRPGMRIPLAHIQEVASLFPSDRNEIRDIFERGMQAVKDDDIRLRPKLGDEDPPYVVGSPFREDEKDLMYIIQIGSRISMPHLEGDTYRLAKWLLPAPSPAAYKALLEVVMELSASQNELHNLQMLAFTLDNHLQDSRFHDLRESYGYGDALNHIQAFFLGYWYQLLLPLLDSSQLSSTEPFISDTTSSQVQSHTGKEAFGSWGWSDIDCVNFIRETVRTRLHRRVQSGKVYSLFRFEVLKLMSYLFGGAELSQVRGAKFGAVGVLGKLPLVYSSLLGGKPDHFGKFSLLDIDTSCIPSSASGIVLPGSSKVAQNLQPKSQDIMPAEQFDWKTISLLADDEFTTHIEPDWSYDTQTCLVAYRHRGRIVHRLNPRQIDLALARQTLAGPDTVDPAASLTYRPSEIIESMPGADPRQPDQEPPVEIPKDCCLVPLQEFHGGFTVYPEERLANTNREPPGYSFTPLIINTSGSLNSLVCIACMYEGWKGNSSVQVIRTQEDFGRAIENCRKVLILSKDSH